MATEIHQGDSGTAIEVTLKDDAGAIIDVSAATTKQLVLSKPSGVRLTRDISFVTDGTDGRIQYIIQVGDLDEEGHWKLQSKVALPTGSWSSSIAKFRVYPNLD